MIQSKENVKIELKTIQAFLLDMDGTIYLGKELIPGAVDFVQFLQEQEIPFLFLTNNPSSDAVYYSSKLQQMGIDVSPVNILTAGAATAIYLSEETPYRRVFVLGTPSFEAELQRVGMQLEDTNPDAVVLSFDKTLTYPKLERACLLLSKGIPYIATNPDRVCPMEYGYIPDCGAIAALLEAATGRRPLYIGKPEPRFAWMALRKLGTDPAHTAMVGDRLYTDMVMAKHAGMPSILVLTGETTPDHLSALVETPDFVVSSVRELHHQLMNPDQ